MDERKSQVTVLLEAWASGDSGALDALLPLVIDDLRRVAHNLMEREAPGHTLNATALVNELYLKLAAKRSVRWESRAQFFATMAQLMRRILVDHARRRTALRKGSAAAQMTIDRALDVPEAGGVDRVDLAALHQALDRLAEMDPRQARIVEMRFFAGMTLKETAASLGVATMPVKRAWRSARRWLLRELSGGQRPLPAGPLLSRRLPGGRADGCTIRRPKPSNAEAVPLRPADADDGPAALVDEKKLEEAVHFINRKTILSGLDLAREVGKYILDKFFDGDYQSFANPSSAKEKSFRALLARQDLLLGNTTLYNFVRVSHQLELLPSDLMDRLPLTHHRALLPLPDPKRKEELARRALAEGWTSGVLMAEVSKLLPASRRGRKPSPLFVKTIRRVAKVVDSLRGEDLHVEEIPSLGRQQTAVLAAQLEEDLDLLQALKKALDATRIQVWPDDS